MTVERRFPASVGRLTAPSIRLARQHEAMDDASELTEAEVNDLLSDDDHNAGWEDAESYEWTR